MNATASVIGTRESGLLSLSPALLSSPTDAIALASLSTGSSLPAHRVFAAHEQPQGSISLTLELALIVAVLSVGFFVGPIQPVAIETGAEVTYPAPESSTTAIQQVLGEPHNIASVRQFWCFVCFSRTISDGCASAVSCDSRVAASSPLMLALRVMQAISPRRPCFP